MSDSAAGRPGRVRPVGRTHAGVREIAAVAAATGRTQASGAPLMTEDNHGHLGSAPQPSLRETVARCTDQPDGSFLPEEPDGRVAGPPWRSGRKMGHERSREERIHVEVLIPRSPRRHAATFLTVSQVRVVTSWPKVFSMSVMNTAPFGLGT